MKIIQKLGVVILLLLLTISLTQAQDNERPSVEERVERQTEKLTKALDLDPNQSTQFKTIRLKYAKQREALRGERTTANRDAMKAIREAEKTELETILSTEQLQKLTVLKNNRRTGKGKGRKMENTTPEQRAEKITAKMTTELGLSTLQTKQVKAINLKYANRRDAIRAERTGENREAIHTAMKEIRKEHKAALEKVLTEEQITKLTALEKERRDKKRGHHKGHLQERKG